MLQRCFLTCCLSLLPSTCFSEVGDVLIATDHPHYPGEGQFQTPEDCVRWATRNATSDQQRALAIFEWLLTHQWHLHSPQEWCQIGRRPGEKSSDYEMVVYDANRGRFSYGYGLCGTVHAWNEVYWNSAGFMPRRRAFPGHTNSEVFVDGKWRMYDTDMAGVVLGRDGEVTGYKEIAADLKLLDRDQNGLPKYPFAWPADYQTMKKGWKQVANGGNWHKLYYGGYAAQPGIVHLRSGETFTRFSHPNAFGGKDKRRFWHQQENGPHRVWTFANGGTPKHNGGQSNCKGRTKYGNAVFEYQPDLTKAKCFEGTQSARDVKVTPKGLSALADGAVVVFEHYSPYVICGDPVDNEDPMIGKATDGMIIQLECDKPIRVDMSADQGQTWTKLGVAKGTSRLDATEFAKGRYGWLIRLAMPETATLQKIQFATTCQMCETIYPRLKDNGTRVTYKAKSRSVVPVLPQLTDEQSTIDRYEARKLRSDNLEFLGRSSKQRMAYRVRGPKSASVVLKIPSRSDLVGISAAARFAVRSPTPTGARYDLHYSLDGGKNWHELGSATPPTDNEFSSGWVYGASENIANRNASAKNALLRITLFGGGYGTGLLAAELYGLRRTASTSSVEVTYRWTENGKKKSHCFVVPEGTHSHSESIPTGEAVTNESVQISAR